MWSQGICIFTSWVWKPILSWALEDKCKHRHALRFKVRLDFGFQQFGRLDVVDGLRTLLVQNVAVVDVARLGLTLLRPCELQSARLLCRWDFPGRNTGVGCHFLLQGIFPTQGSNLYLLLWQVGSLPLSRQRSPWYGTLTCKWKIQRTLFACTAEPWETEEKSQGLKMKIAEQSWRCYGLGSTCWVLLAVPAERECVYTHVYTEMPVNSLLLGGHTQSETVQ